MTLLHIQTNALQPLYGPARRKAIRALKNFGKPVYPNSLCITTDLPRPNGVDRPYEYETHLGIKLTVNSPKDAFACQLMFIENEKKVVLMRIQECLAAVMNGDETLVALRKGRFSPSQYFLLNKATFDVLLSHEHPMRRLSRGDTSGFTCCGL